jgi:hypothetical protein
VKLLLDIFHAFTELALNLCDCIPWLILLFQGSPVRMTMSSTGLMLFVEWAKVWPVSHAGRANRRKPDDRREQEDPE